MLKKIETSTLVLLLVFAFYCSLVIGTAWDEMPEIYRGHERLKYLFSFGSLENYWKETNDEFYAGFYSTLTSFITKMFPKKLEYEIWHLTNSLFSILTIFGIYKISSNLFSKKVGKIVFLLCFLNPIFFGHMAINPKDTIIAFANIWSTYIFLRYLQKQNHNNNCYRYILFAGLTIGLGTGVRLPFIITLFPLFIFAIFDILFLKKIINKNFSFKKFIFHLIFVLLIAYLITISCWPHVHKNILTEPFKLFWLFNERINSSATPIVGLGWMLFNGNFISTDQLPNSYLLINFFYKSPEFILLSYIIFGYLVIFKKRFFLTKFNIFLPKIFLILFIFLFPIVYFIVSPYFIYDGLRLLLYLMPYFCIIPGLAIHYLFNNFNSLLSKFMLGGIAGLFIYFLYIFILLTPYQYTYLNKFVGNFSEAYKKFENDYWAASIKELVKKIPDETNLIINNKKIEITFCGLHRDTANKELKKLKNLKFDEQSIQAENFKYVIMTNRVVVLGNNDTKENMKTCFEKYKGEDLITVERNGLILSTLRRKL